jgi:hypothetical protein
MLPHYVGLNTEFILTPLSIHIDFEQAMHNVLMRVFPACKIDCCRFHLAELVAENSPNSSAEFRVQS